MTEQELIDSVDINKLRKEYDRIRKEMYCGNSVDVYDTWILVAYIEKLHNELADAEIAIDIIKEEYKNDWSICTSKSKIKKIEG